MKKPTNVKAPSKLPIPPAHSTQAPTQAAQAREQAAQAQKPGLPHQKLFTMVWGVRSLHCVACSTWLKGMPVILEREFDEFHDAHAGHRLDVCCYVIQPEESYGKEFIVHGGKV